MENAQPHAHHFPHHHGHAAVAEQQPMHMTFSLTSDCGPLLFSWWHPRSMLSYLMSLGIVFALGAGSEWLSMRARAGPFNPAVAAATDEMARMCDNEPATRHQSKQPRSLARTGALHAASIALNMAVMLLAMSFNVGVFVALVLGVAIARTVTSSGRAGEAAAARSGIELCH